MPSEGDCTSHQVPSGGRGNGTLRLRNYGLYFLFTFLFVAYSSLRVTPCNSGLSPFGPALPFQPQLQGGPDLISSAAVAIAKMMMSYLGSDELNAAPRVQRKVVW